MAVIITGPKSCDNIDQITGIFHQNVQKSHFMSNQCAQYESLKKDIFNCILSGTWLSSSLYKIFFQNILPVIYLFYCTIFGIKLPGDFSL